MTVTYSRVATRQQGASLHGLLAPFPLVCFTLALLTDIAYSRTANILWVNASSWLLFAGLVGGGLALLLGIIDLLMRRRDRAGPSVWPYAIVYIVVLVLGVANSFVHAGDGWTAVVPSGLWLSGITFLAVLVTIWLGRTLSHRWNSDAEIRMQ